MWIGEAIMAAERLDFNRQSELFFAELFYRRRQSAIGTAINMADPHN